MERVAKLSWGVAVIKVGAASEVEMKEKKLRIEDALNATRAAVEEWVVAWGWVALLKASQILESLDLWNEDQNIWVSIVRQALSYPIRQIVENAWKEWSVIINKIIEEKSKNYWYNAANDTFVDMINTWIIDPKKVERVALEEAISLAWMFLTTEAAVTEIPKKDDGCSWSCNTWAWMWGMWGMPWMGMY
jgi:chaperonin GroEL